MTLPLVWTIAGSDPSGGAGLQADLKTFHDFNVEGASIITAITIQNTVSVAEVAYVTPELLTQQIRVLANDLPPRVIKLGMQGAIQPVANFLKNYSGFVVCDPVIKSSNGQQLLADLDGFTTSILPYTDLLTPNIIEAEFLTQRKIKNYIDMQQAAEQLLSFGVKSVYVKGGHFDDNQFCQDYYTDGRESFWLSNFRIQNIHTHGSGCTLASAIAACLALNYPLKDALVIGKMYIQQGIRLATAKGQGVGAVAHKGFPREGIDFPYLTDNPLTTKPIAFPTCGSNPLGLYPVVDSSTWVERVAKAGVNTIQLRIKDKSSSEIKNEIQAAIAIARHYECRLFINDYWQWAIALGAYGVHLGQEDLQTADIAAIHKAGLRLGVSTHCFYEVARAHALNPSYLACGPIFHTNSKAMPFAPQGLEKLRYWQQLLNYPWVAIGGIDQSSLPDVVKIGVDGVAMISAITKAPFPEQRIKELLVDVV